MIAEDYENDGLRRLVVCRGLDLGRMLVALPLASGEEGGSDKNCAGRGEGEGPAVDESRPEALLLLFVDGGETADRLPDLLAILGVARGWGDGFDGGEVVAEYGVAFSTFAALVQVTVDARGLRGFTVVVLDELFFSQMVHAITLMRMRLRLSAA